MGVTNTRALLCLILCTSSALSEILTNLQTLRLVQVIFRHGDRSPAKSYPTNPYGNASIFWPMGLGQLTPIGKAEQYKLGQYLRTRYNNFIPREYNSQEIQMMSSVEPRVVQSAQNTLAGLFENIASTNSTSTDDILKWVQSTIPIKTLPKLKDNILAATTPCERVDQIYSDPMHGNNIENLSKENRTLVEYIRKQTGHSNETSFIDLIAVEDTIIIGNIHNLTIPNWINSSMLDQFREIRLEFEIQYTSTVELKKLRIGPLLDILLRNLKNAVNGDGPVKLVLYAGHDITLISLMDTLGVFNSIVPPYSSAILIELHESFDTYWVETFYRNESQRNPFPIVLPGCSFKCSLGHVVNLTSDFIPKDWEAECTTTSALLALVTKTLRISGRARLGVIILILLGAVVPGVILIRRWRSRSDSGFGKEMKHVYGSTLERLEPIQSEQRLH